MSLFSPDAVFGALARMLGTSPEQLRGVVGSFAARINALDSEIAGFKAASGQMVAHYNCELAEIKVALAAVYAIAERIETKLDAAADDAAQPQPVNGRKAITQ